MKPIDGHNFQRYIIVILPFWDSFIKNFLFKWLKHVNNIDITMDIIILHFKITF